MSRSAEEQLPQDVPALRARRLGVRYRRGWVLSGCELSLPASRICALVGPNGAGKSTLMALAAGVLAPTEGTVEVFGHAPDSAEGRRRIALLAQDRPLHPRLSIADTLRMGRELNPAWDQAAAERVLAAADVDPKTRVGRLSGGQRTRVALALALGKRPDLLLLDEPLADLDPVARHELTGLLLAEAAEHGTTVLISSHVPAELAGVCDHLLVLGEGYVRLAGEVDELLSAHRKVAGAHEGVGTPPVLAGHEVVELRRTGRQATALIRTTGPVHPDWDLGEPTLEELLLGYLRAPGAADPQPTPSGMVFVMEEVASS
ncbi:ATP-binding cassette domain-containing protein [Kitasatospora sp. NPDC096147]|uniref:ATP-binding cassette domain-containing protein n=1 Tax=Kitasatospora sp. NPDC096147 TaxID=3364093 RepID=UPI0038268001